MVAQNTLRTNEEKQLFFGNNYRIQFTVDVKKCLSPLELPNSLYARTMHIWATIFYKYHVISPFFLKYILIFHELNCMFFLSSLKIEQISDVPLLAMFHWRFLINP